MKEEYQQAYRNYCLSHTTGGKRSGMLVIELPSVVPIEHSFDTFVEECKRDEKFFNRWK